MAGRQWRYDGVRWAEHEWAQTAVLFAVVPDWRNLIWANHASVFDNLVKPVLDEMYRDKVAPELEAKGIDSTRYSLGWDTEPIRMRWDVAMMEQAIDDMIRRREAMQRLGAAMDVPPEIRSWSGLRAAGWPEGCVPARCATEVMWCSGDWKAVSDTDGVREDATDEPHRRGGDP